MKKTFILISLLITLLFSGLSQGITLVDWSVINGAFRATSTNFNGLLLLTTAKKNDFYYACKSVTSYPAGIYQAKKNNPTVATNWKFVYPMISTNAIGTFSVVVSNTALTMYTQVLHPIVKAEIVTATNTLHPISKAEIVAATNASRLNTYYFYTNVLNLHHTNQVMLRSIDSPYKRYRLYISNSQVKAITNQ